jgi:hypothetical protein
VKRLYFEFKFYQNIAFFVLFFLVTCFVSKAQYYYDYNSEIKLTYELIIDLKIQEAQEKIKVLKNSQKNNLSLIHIENYIDFFTLFITEDIGEYNRRVANKSARIDFLENIDLSSQYHRFVKAEILLQWALIHIKFDDKIKAGSNVYEAYNLLEANKKEFPNFIDNNKSLSIIHALAESVPSWVRKLIGVKGSISQGKEEIEKISKFALANKGYFYREEVAAIYSYILFYQLNMKDKAINELEKFHFTNTSSPLIAFLQASMYLRNGQNNKCLEALSAYSLKQNQLPFYYLDFMKGRSLLYKQEVGSDKYLLSFVKKFKGRHFIKEAYQKLAWYELSFNSNAVQYQKYMNLCISEGKDLVDEDKQALKEAKSKVVPNAILLKARILFDGGYASQALTTLVKNEATLEANPKTNIEFNYRIGRIFQALKNYKEAIQYLSATINKSGSKNYFGANAALQIGFIYEDLKQTKNALVYFEKCLAMDPPEFKNSLHQKAKSGIQRLQKK